MIVSPSPIGTQVAGIRYTTLSSFVLDFASSTSAKKGNSVTLKNTAPRLSPAQLEANFTDINPPLSPSQALEEGSRCLFCYDAPCIKACPTRINIPMFIHQIVTSDLAGSGKTILDANILGQSCGRVCPTSVLCEGMCVLNAEGKRPVSIGRLQRYAVDHVLKHRLRLFSPGAPTGFRVALIGAGPASLSCAFELRRRGHQTVVFDARSQPGGLNTYGIAAYKMRAQEALREIEMIREMGVEIRNGVTVSKDISFAQLESEFDAIFLGVGLGATDHLKIPGEDLEGSLDSLAFIEQTKSKSFADIVVGCRIAVIGGGNTAIDVVTAAHRLGAEDVCMIYRRGREEMSAFDYEYELAKKDGITFIWQATPTRIIGDRVVEKLECIRTVLGELDASGRRSPQIQPGTEFTLDVDMVVRALGQTKLVQFLRSIPQLELNKGRVVVDENTMQTGNPKYFAGGDCVNGAGEVVDAVAHGKAAAGGIHQMLASSTRRAHA
jgi:dihydropyrimidine dehydrogenase (NAD+) subunit PreT